MLKIEILPARTDNYMYLLWDEQTHQACIIDPTDGKIVLAALQERSLTLDSILCTHHHFDHVGGNSLLHETTGAPVLGYEGDAHRIPSLTTTVKEGQVIDMLGSPCEIFFTPGHTSGHIGYYFPQEEAYFSGDTLFSLGCGRLFEGSAAELYDSLQKIMSLPDNTALFVGHEYTVDNARFAQHYDPGNATLAKRVKEARVLRAKNQPTLPVTVATEKATNPFLRCHLAEIQSNFSEEHHGDPIASFAMLRKAKDVF